MMLLLLLIKIMMNDDDVVYVKGSSLFRWAKIRLFSRICLTGIRHQYGHKKC